MFIRIFLIAASLFIFNFCTNAQATASASVSANIINQVGAESGADLAFNQVDEQAAMKIIESGNRGDDMALQTTLLQNSVSATFSVISSYQLYNISVAETPVTFLNNDHPAISIKNFSLAELGYGSTLTNQKYYKLDAQLSIDPVWQLNESASTGTIAVTINFN